MRFAILTAVSSKSQAAESKDSLPVQEQNCRCAALSRSWIETAGPYIIPGQPRTGYVNLSDAEREIPALAAMLDAARDGAFDVLIIYDYSRLRDLVALVAASLADYSVQIYSLAQAVEPVPPDQFDPALSDAVWFNQLGAGISSRAEINALRRRFRQGMPGRVTKKGLHALGRLPYGYRKPAGHESDRLAVPEPDPAIAPAILQMRDLFLSGRSLTQIADEIRSAGYPTRLGGNWHPETIRFILHNPYYAGIVTFGVLHTRKDSRFSRKGRQVRSTAPVHSGPGRHAPFWDESTRQRILAEFARRSKAYPGRRLSRFSGLLFCSECRRLLWVGYHSFPNHPANGDTRIYYCSSRIHGHPRLKETGLLPSIAARAADLLAHLEDIPNPSPTSDLLPFLRKQSVDLDARQSRLLEAYLSGTIPLLEFNELKAGLSARQAQAAAVLHRAEDTSARQAERTASRRLLADRLERIPAFIQEADPQTVNAMLREVFDKIVVSSVGELEFVWR
jgi:hypothetical protein